MAITKLDTTKTPVLDMWKYSTGEGANSLVINAIFSFSMVYFTDALGLKHYLAGIAMSVATFWDATIDPIMAYITDNTRSRFGRRHQYILIGGITTVVCSFFIWCVPEVFRYNHLTLFLYLVVINLILRTAIAIFVIPYGALGFEICTDYDGRAKLQGIKAAFNMALNLVGPGITGWYFLRDLPDGTKGTSIPGNYLIMGAVYAIAGLVFILMVVFLTRKYIVDTRNEPQKDLFSFKVFYDYFRDILANSQARVVFAFMFVTMLGTILVCSLQMYVYIHFMNFPTLYKSIVHSSSMVGCGLGALVAHYILKKFDDKKSVVYVAVALSVLANIVLLVIFVGKLMPVDYAYPLGNIEIPVAMITFLFFHALYWFGNGVVSPIAWSMMADLSEIGKYKTGELRDGGYGAVLIFIIKVAMSIGLLISGFCLTWAGLEPGADLQTAQASQNAASITFIGGSIIYILATLIMRKYTINRALMHRIKNAIAAKERGEDYEQIDI